MLRSKIIIALFLLQINLLAQVANTKITFIPQYANQTIVLNDTSNEKCDSSEIKINVLKFYISQIKFLNKNKIVFTEKNSFHLLDVSKPESLTINFNNNLNADEIEFSLGIDSICNVSGAMSGDLDPTKGMYWTWQSGYINFKLEGKSQLIKNKKNEFVFHLGGYSFPYNALQIIKLPLVNDKDIQIKLDLENLFSQINLNSTSSIMSPSKEAVRFSEKLVKCFNVILK